MTDRPSVLLSYVHPGTVTSVFFESILRLFTADRSYDLAINGRQSGVLISKARNELVQDFLSDERFTHFLSIDTDVEFKESDVEALLRADLPIVSGLYYSRDLDGEVWPVAMKYDKDSGRYLRQREKLEGDKPVHVAAVGFGFVLVRRDVLEKVGVGPLWPFAEILHEGRGIGEDITFCIRAREKGFRPMILPSARVGHSKAVIL